MFLFDKSKRNYKKKIPYNDPCFNSGWKTDNNSVELNSKEVDRLISIVPSQRQKEFQNMEFMTFIHFGVNTFTAREWGDGTESESIFNPTNLDTDQWCQVIKSSGSKGIILTCKHHDGFCLFQTEYTEHSIKNSPYKNGKGDILAELAESCRKYDLKLGVYLSPWDRNNKDYGTKKYDDYFCNQLTELLTNYGEIAEVWFDGAKGKNVADFDYDWQRYYKLIRSLQPQAVISVCGPDVRWCGNEAGKCRKSEWNVVDATVCDVEKIAANSQNEENDTNKLQILDAMDEDLGSRDLLKKSQKLIWYPAEVDVSIRKGWFHKSSENKTVKSADKLFDIYCSSVGGNASLLLNVPPTKEGLIDEIDAQRLKELGDKISNLTNDPVFEMDNIEINKNYIDIIFDWEQINAVILKEDLDYSQRVEEFELYLGFGEYYKKVYSGTTIGSKKIIRLPKYANEKCSSIRLLIKQSRSTPKLNFIGAYK